MTTPAPGSVTSGSFGGVPFPPEVVARVIDLLVTGAPFGASMTRYPTNRGSVAWPTAKPTGYAWRAELAALPVVDLDDDAYVVAVAKIGAVLDLSNESIADPTFNIGNAVGDLLRDSLSRELDLGLLNGSGPPEPRGVIAAAAEVSADDLLDAVATARGQIADAGGAPSTLALSGAALAAADTSRDSNGQLVYPLGFASAVGLTAVVVPELATPLVYDASRCYLVVREDVAVEASRDFHFANDATSIRVRARVAAAIPAPGKSIRKLDVGGARTARAAKPAGKN
jgi:HK97 family phage major capsid protein